METRGDLVTDPEMQGRRWSVTIYCGQRFEAWGPESLWRGIGGSEEAVILAARHLARRGCSVEVFGEPLETASVSADGVRWSECASFDAGRGGDVFIAWRNHRFVDLAGRYAQKYHWMHDPPEFGYPHDYVDRFDRIFALSDHHANSSGFGPAREKLYRTSNGLDGEFLRPPGSNEPQRAIYPSCPARGLILVLQAWPAIRRQVPNAILDVFYGFSSDYDEMARAYPGLTWIKNKVLELVKQEGVFFHGRVGQDRLAEAFARAGVWVYPTEAPETSCITAMKALAMGCIPVTSGYGVLTETLGARDLGPVHKTQRISHSRWRQWRFRRCVVDVMRRGSSPEIRARRMEWSKWARAKYSWSAVAEDWCRLFAETERQKASQRRTVA